MYKSIATKSAQSGTDPKARIEKLDEEFLELPSGSHNEFLMKLARARRNAGYTIEDATSEMYFLYRKADSCRDDATRETAVIRACETVWDTEADPSKVKKASPYPSVPAERIAAFLQRHDFVSPWPSEAPTTASEAGGTTGCHAVREKFIATLRQNRRGWTGYGKDAFTLRPTRKAQMESQYMTVNALKDDARRRTKENIEEVTALLLEFDNALVDGMTIQEQTFALLDILPVKPFCVTFSGGKSYHALFAIKPVSCSDYYSKYRSRLVDIYKFFGIDTANTDTTRWTRTPFAVRDNGAFQYSIEYPNWQGPTAIEDVLDAFDGFIHDIVETVPEDEQKAAEPTTADTDEVVLNEVTFAEFLKEQGIDIWYDAINQEVDFTGLPDKSHNRLAIHLCSLWQISGRSKRMPNCDVVRQLINGYAGTHYRNPVTEYLESLSWDGRDRLEDVYVILGITPDRTFDRMLVRKWFLQCVAMAYNDGRYGNEGVLTLLGPQGIGKTTFFRTLVPAEKRDAWFHGGLVVDAQEKDSRISLTKRWIIELGEVDATTRKEQSALKSLITDKVLKERLPYGTAPETFIRHASLAATLNRPCFLHERENRRWWTVRVSNINMEMLDALDIGQLWAEMLEIWQDDKVYYLTREEMAELNSKNGTYRPVDFLQDELNSIYDFEAPKEEWTNRKRLKEIINTEAFHSSSFDQIEKNIRKLSMVLAEMGVDRPKIGGQTFAFMPPLRGQRRPTPPTPPTPPAEPESFSQLNISKSAPQPELPFTGLLENHVETSAPVPEQTKEPEPVKEPEPQQTPAKAVDFEAQINHDLDFYYDLEMSFSIGVLLKDYKERLGISVTEDEFIKQVGIYCTAHELEVEPAEQGRLKFKRN